MRICLCVFQLFIDIYTLQKMDVEPDSIEYLKYLADRLSRDDIKKLLSALSVPEGVCSECDSAYFW